VDLLLEEGGLVLGRRGEEGLAALAEGAGKFTLGEPVFSLGNLNANRLSGASLSLEEEGGIVDVGRTGTVGLTAGLEPTRELGRSSLGTRRKELAASIDTGSLASLVILVESSRGKVDANVGRLGLGNDDPVLADFDAGGSKLLAGRVPLAAVGGWHLLLAGKRSKEP